MSFDQAARPPRPAGRRWSVRLFETSDKLEEYLNRSNLRPDQIASLTIDNDGFFVLLHSVGGPPAEGGHGGDRGFAERRPPRPRAYDEDFEGEPPFRRDEGGAGFRRGDEGGFRRGEEGGFRRGGGRPFGRDEGPPGRGFPPRRPPPRR